MRIAVIVLGFQAHFGHHRQRLLPALLFAQAGVDLQRLFQNLPHLFTRVQRTVGVLEHNLDFLPAQLLRLRIVLKQVLSLVIELAAGGDFNHRQQTTERGFTAAGLPHYRQRFTAFKGKRDAVQRLDQAFRREEPLLHRIVFFQIGGQQQRLLRGGLMRTHSPGLPASSSG